MIVTIICAVITGAVIVLVGWFWLVHFASLASIPARVLLAVTCTVITLAAFWLVCASVAITVAGLSGGRL